MTEQLWDGKEVNEVSEVMNKPVREGHKMKFCLEKIWIGGCYRRFLRIGRFSIRLIPFRDDYHHHWSVARRTYNKNDYGHGTLVMSINPILGWKRKIQLFFLRKVLKWFDSEHIRCRGCGEGIIKYSIKDPNYPENAVGKSRWLVCNGCVNFYDQHWSAKEVLPMPKRK